MKVTSLPQPPMIAPSPEDAFEETLKTSLWTASKYVKRMRRAMGYKEQEDLLESLTGLLEATVEMCESRLLLLGRIRRLKDLQPDKGPDPTLI